MWLYGARQAAGNKVSLRSLMFPTTWNSRPPEYCAAYNSTCFAAFHARFAKLRAQGRLRQARNAKTVPRIGSAGSKDVGSAVSVSRRATQYIHMVQSVLYTGTFEVTSIWNKSNWNTLIEIRNTVWKFILCTGWPKSNCVFLRANERRIF